MTSNLEFILKLTDMFSPALKSASQISNTATSQIKSQFTGIEYSGKKLGASVNELRDRLDGLNKIRFGTHIKKEFNDATSAAIVLERKIQKMENRGSGGGLGSVLGGIAASVGISSIVKDSLAQSASTQNQQIAFKVLTGSKKSGDALFNNVEKMADSTPFETADLAGGAKTMLGYGVDQKQIMPMLKMLGDIASASDAPTQSLHSLSLAFGQIQAKGHLAGQESLQLINAGFNPLKEISDMTGVSMADMSKKMEQGAISADMVKLAFEHATGPGGKFHDMMNQQAQTLGGKWSTFMDGVHHKLRELGNLLAPIANSVMSFGTALMDNKLALALFAGAIGLITIATGGWTVAQAALNFVMALNPVVAIIAGIMVLIGIIVMLVKHFEGWGKTWHNLMDFCKFSWAAFKDSFMIVWLVLQDQFMSGIELIEKGWYHLKGLWDKEGAAAGLAKINNEQNSRAEEIAKTKGLLLSHVKAAEASLKWEVHAKKDVAKTVSPVTAAIDYKKEFAKAGVKGGKDDLGKDKSDSINQGGQRSIVINIGKQIEKIEQHIIGGGREAADEIESAVREAMRRVVYSLNGVAS